MLADWNGLMIGALARASVIFGKPAWAELAKRAFTFVDTTMCPDGRLRHSYRAGAMTASATASDYANMIHAALRLHQIAAEPQYLAAALKWLAVLDRHYWVAGTGGYATTADDTKDVIVRLVSAQDDAVPSANTVMLSNLMHLFLITGESRCVDRADAIQHAFAPDLARSLTQHTGFLANAIDLIAPQLVVVGESVRTGDIAPTVNAVSLPGALMYVLSNHAHMALDLPPGLKAKTALNNAPAAYLCLGPKCQLPITDPDTLRKQLKELRTAASSTG